MENGTATITEFTARLIADGIKFLNKDMGTLNDNFLVCGGGRKNQFLIDCIKNNFDEINLDPIEKYEINGDFVESQAFAFLAIRSFTGMPISFPTTTRCKEPLTGGIIVENF